MDIYATIRTYWAEVLKDPKNKPKYSNILHVLEVSTYFLHQTHKVG